MDIKERILAILKKEFEPFGYRYLKSQSTFKRRVGKDIIVSLYYNASCSYRGYTTITFYARGTYLDLKKELQNQCFIDVEYWYFGFCNRLQWLMPEGRPYSSWDFVFRNDDTEEAVNQKLEEMAWCVRTYLIPFLERLSHRSSALEEAIERDRWFLITDKFLVPIMFCVWKHDKKAALDYLEKRGQRLLSLVKPGQWERLERMKNGETFTQDDTPLNAMVYEEYIEGAQKIREWIESLDYGGFNDIC